jgi:hypothetical protein
LKFGSPDKAAEVFQALLSSFALRMQNSMNLNSIVSTLSWLYDAYFDMNNFPVCIDIVQSIKDVRSKTLGCTELTDLSAGAEMSQLHSSPMKSRDSPGGNGYANDSQSEEVPPANAPSAPKSKSFVKYIKSMFSTNKAKSSNHHNDVSKVPPHLQKGHSRKMKNQRTNSSDSNLTKHCITDSHIDLGALMARAHFAEKKYVSALTSITPTIIGVELFVGGKSGSKDGISELGQLYFLRGKIQLEACKSSSNVSYPFQVGSNRLFSTIQDLYLQSNHDKTQNLSGVAGSARRFARATDETANKNRSRSENIPLKEADSLTFLTCKRSICYSCPSDLLWDAMKWFRRAWVCLE